MQLFVAEDSKFKLYTCGVPYKIISGLIRNKLTGEIFEGEITIYKYLLNGQWVYEDDNYEAIPYPVNYKNEVANNE